MTSAAAALNPMDGTMSLAPPARRSASTSGARRRIALLLTDLNGGGVQKMTLALAGGLIDRGHEVEILLYEANGVLEPQVPAGVVVRILDPGSAIAARLAPLWADPLALPKLLLPIVLARKPPPGLNCLPALARYLKATEPDALLTAVPSCNLAAVWAKRLAGVDTRVLISERTAPSKMLSKSGNWRARFLPDLMRRTYQQADVIVSVSEALGDDLATVTGIPRRRIVTIYNPVVGGNLAELAAEPLTHPWFQPGEPPVILSAGRLSPQKDLPTLVRAFADLRQTVRARLVILGGATANGKTELRQTDLVALARSLGVEDDVALAGFVSNPYAYMSRARVLALSSAWEGFGNVLVEAMACGCPVVSTDCPSGPAEILDGGRFGPLVPVGDAPRLAAALAGVLSAPPDSAILRERADEFTVERSVDAYLLTLFGQS